jgi:hypothetical protein
MLVRRNLILGGLATSVFASAVSGCQTKTVGQFRYRLTVEVETPEGLKSGYSVIQVKAIDSDNMINMPHAASRRVQFKGEAVVVELPEGRVLFALLKDKGGANRADYFPMYGFMDRWKGIPTERAVKYQQMANWRGQTMKLGHPYAELSPTDPPDAYSTYPLFVTFTDVNNPLTVRILDPVDFAATLGPGFALKQATVTITDEKVTTGKILPYYKRLGLDRNLSLNDGEKSAEIGFGPIDTTLRQKQPSFAQTVGRDFFIQEELN